MLQDYRLHLCSFILMEQKNWNCQYWHSCISEVSGKLVPESPYWLIPSTCATHHVVLSCLLLHSFHPRFPPDLVHWVRSIMFTFCFEVSSPTPHQTNRSVLVRDEVLSASNYGYILFLLFISSSSSDRHWSGFHTDKSSVIYRWNSHYVE